MVLVGVAILRSYAHYGTKALRIKVEETVEKTVDVFHRMCLLSR